MRKHYFRVGGKYYGASVAPPDYTPGTLERFIQQQTVREVSEEEYQVWNHSECQTSCVRRGADKCVW